MNSLPGCELTSSNGKQTPRECQNQCSLGIPSVIPLTWSSDTTSQSKPVNRKKLHPSIFSPLASLSRVRPSPLPPSAHWLWRRTPPLSSPSSPFCRRRCSLIIKSGGKTRESRPSLPLPFYRRYRSIGTSR